MKVVIKNVLVLVLFMVSSLCSAQMFSVDELIQLSEDNQNSFRNTVVDRGYSNENTIDNGLSRSYEYSTASGHSVISLVLPSFSSGVRMLTWDFKIPSAYEELKYQLERGNYRLTNTEKRKAGKYLSLYYSCLGFDFILTADKTSNLSGKYIFSVKTTKAVESTNSGESIVPLKSTSNGW